MPCTVTERGKEVYKHESTVKLNLTLSLNNQQSFDDWPILIHCIGTLSTINIGTFWWIPWALFQFSQNDTFCQAQVKTFCPIFAQHLMPGSYLIAKVFHSWIRIIPISFVLYREYENLCNRECFAFNWAYSYTSFKPNPDFN